MIEQYLKDIYAMAKTGDAREESYYPALKQFLENYATKNKKEITVISLPKKTDAGNPDFKIRGQRSQLVGYIEAKDPGIEDLDKIAESKQLKRYRDTFHNLILTNFLEFRLYREGQLVEKVQIGQSFVATKLKLPPPAQNLDKFYNLLDKFLAFQIPQTTTAKQLAIELANYTKFLREQIIQEELLEERIDGVQTLEAYFQSFKLHLIPSLDLPQFADLFAQTIAYGLFAAKSQVEGEFNRKLAYEHIPPTVGILRGVFKLVASADLSPKMSWLVDDIAEVLDKTNVSQIIDRFYAEGKGKDPIIHFYETFLAVYDPATREKRGVYYTPEQVVGFIVRSVHKLLKDGFGKPDGLADTSVTLLDPAAGTLTFPAEAIRQAIAEHSGKYGQGGTFGLIKEHLLKNFYAFELMMAPYTIGHLKIGLILKELGYELSADDRFQLFLTNTLDFTPPTKQMTGPLEQPLTNEQTAALTVKEKTPIMVVLGNPPYSGQSENKSDWVLRAIETYKQVDGAPLGEKNPKWLQDDYVKFFRFAQWKIEQAGQGVLAFITNHAWLDNPTFRGMRASLLQTFNEAYILNLHGNSLKKEKSPDGSKDENVFDIRTGVAITILVKRPAASDKRLVHYADLFGLREAKYQYLDISDIATTEWQILSPASPHYRLVPESTQDTATYEKFWPIQKIFPKNSVGIVTARDKLTIGWTKDEIRQRIIAFTGMDSESARSGYSLGPDARDWQVALAQKDLIDSGLDQNKIVPILYRPFDTRWTYYTGKSRGFICMPRPEIMKHMLQPNLAIMVCRQYSGDIFTHVLIANGIVESSYISNKTKEITYCLPLYKYSEKAQVTTSVLGDDKSPNIDPELVKILKQTLKYTVSPEDILYYAYAILYTPSYRQQYSDLLKSDFPRVPFTSDPKLFKQIAELGKELTALHLLTHPDIDNPLVKFHGVGDNLVGAISYDEAAKHISINTTQYFEPVPADAWQYMIGGYQVLAKWLKDRHGRALSSDEVITYCRTATAIIKTIEIQAQLDKLYPQVEQTLINPTN